MTKEQLYCLVEKIRRDYGISYPPPYQTKALCSSSFGLYVNVLEIKTPKLRGMSHIPSRSIMLDSKMSDFEQNFYCAHEVMHHIIHKNRPTKLFSCYEETQAEQDSFVEWEANEGAAQFLVPYQDFIPRFSAVLDNPPHKDFWIEGYFSDQYGVSPQVITFRLNNLEYEIDQYRAGVPIDRVNILSKRQRQRLNIAATNYSALCAFPLNWDDQIGIDGYAYSL